MGILIVKTSPDAFRRAPLPDAEDLIRWLIEQAARHERFTVELARTLRNGGDTCLPDPARPISPDLCARLRCPDCGAAVHGAGSGVGCAACGASFAGEFGIPIMYPTRSLDELLDADETLRRLCGDDPARRRTVQRVMRRLRHNERPPGLLRRLSWRLLAPVS